MLSSSLGDICVRRGVQDVMNALLHKAVHQKENIKKSQKWDFFERSIHS
jgi:hypothetical protein